MANRLLYLARHGEYEAAQEAQPKDGELTETGRQQSELLGKRLQGIPFSAIHHSPWRRAVQTAEIGAGHLPGVPLHPSDLLQECIPAVPERQRLTPSQAEFFDLINWFVAQAIDAPDQAWLRMLDYSCALTVIMYFPHRI